MMHANIAVASSLALATLASEDLACIGAGLLAASGEISALTGIAGCAAGIVVGDLGLWAAGRAFGSAALRWRWVGARVDPTRLERMRHWLEKNAARAILTSRFLPGSRLPLYVMAGVSRMSVLPFAGWVLIGALLWTPALVVASAFLGAAAARKLPLLFGVLAAAVLVVRALMSPSNRVRLRARFARWRRWEFWPMALFYLPVAIRVAFLAIRHGGLSTITAANPGMPDGGTVGESKSEILSQLPAEWTIPFALINTGSTDERVRMVIATMRDRSWSFPIIVKPDVGQRGAGVRLMRTIEDVVEYLQREQRPVFAQPFHEGPFEAGVFYYRRPGEVRGRILSITDKRFPVVVGDGQSTLEDLIWRHPRYGMQASTFLERHAASRNLVLPAGKQFQLAIAGNHAQGCLFKNGSHLITPALETRIDEIARSYPAFFIGRFDIRYRDAEAFAAGTDLAIVELNGATAESTEIYDPDNRLIDAYRQLFRQWSLVFEIGAANRAGGSPVTSRRRLAELVRSYLTTSVAYAVSD
jgi:membrane protein DedA with SNARE-associated domain